jgi:hypothetical protein
MARAGGGWAGQLIGISPTRGLAFNWASGMGADAMAEFERRGGGIPEINPRAYASLAAPTFSSVVDDDFISKDSRARSPLYQELFAPFDAPHVCIAHLADVGDIQVLACVIRTDSQGPISKTERQRFGRLGPRLSRALQFQQDVEQKGALLAAGALEAIALPAILLDEQGRVVVATSAGAALLRAEAFVRLRHGRLRAVDAVSDRLLNAALERVRLVGRTGPSVRIVLKDREGRAKLANVAALPRETRSLGVSAVSVVTFSVQRGFEGGEDVLRQVFDLSDAEAKVALMLAKGASTRRWAFTPS